MKTQVKKRFLGIGICLLALAVLAGCKMDVPSDAVNVLGSSEQVYVVTFELRDDVGTVIKQTAKFDAKLVRPEDPKWIGHTFLGWYWENSEKWRDQSNAAVNFDTVKVTGNYKIHARWRTKAKYQVTFDYDTEGVANGVQTVYEGTVIAQPLDPQRDKCTFLMWVNEDGREFDFEQPITADTTIKAKWIRKAIYDVTFDCNNGTANGGYRVTEEDEGWKVPKPEDPTREGVDFDCWTLDGKEYNFDDPVSGDMTLVARWKLKESYEIGDTGPGGGYVFYDKGKTSDGWRYLEVAKYHIGYIMYGYYHNERGENCGVGTSTAIGQGKNNTQKLIAAMGETAYTTTGGADKDIYAAKACDDYSYGGYDDWFLPSSEELNLIYQNLFCWKNKRWGEAFWFISSSEQNNAAYISMDFNFGKRSGSDKGWKDFVLPVRAF